MAVKHKYSDGEKSIFSWNASIVSMNSENYVVFMES